MLPFYLHCLSRGDDGHISLYLYLQKFILVRVCVVCGMWRLENYVSVFCPSSMSVPKIEPGSSGLVEGPRPFTS